MNLFLSTHWLQIILISIIGYMLGSVSSAVIVTKLNTKGSTDIRTKGSGNAGFTNVLRVVGKGPAILTLLFDILKATIAMLITLAIFKNATPEYVSYAKCITGLCCILGHMFPVYFKFKGGKGVVTLAVLLFFLNPYIFLAGFITFLTIFAITKIVSLSVILQGFFLPIYTFFITCYFDFISNSHLAVVTIYIIGLCILIIAKHKENIKRILKGEEKKIIAKKESQV